MTTTSMMMMMAMIRMMMMVMVMMVVVMRNGFLKRGVQLYSDSCLTRLMVIDGKGEEYEIEGSLLECKGQG